MSKPIIEVTNPVYLGNVMYCTLAQDDPTRGWLKGQEIKTSTIINRNPVLNSVETKNTVYMIVAEANQGAE